MDATHVVLEKSHRSILAGARALGPSSQNEWIEVTVKVKRKKELPAIKTRPKAMDRTKLVEAHGAAKEDLDKVVTTLAPYGLHRVGESVAARSVRLAGTASAMEKAFQVRLVRYAHPEGEYRGRVGALSIPRALQGIVVAVFGLDNRRMARKRGGLARPVSPAAARAAVRPWFYPQELGKAYQFPDGDGSGQCIGVLEFGGGYFPDDLKAFCSSARVPNTANVLPISVDNAPTDSQDGAEGEVMLDIEVVAALCPAATIAVYFSSFTEKGWIDGLDTAVHDTDNSPSVLSVSWGFAEGQNIWTDQALDEVGQTLKDAAMLGVTVCVASGDDGADDQVGDGYAHVDFPASSPFVLGVGGTTLRLAGGEVRETAWKDGDGLRADGGGSTGGGVSQHFPLPDWQTVQVASVNPDATTGRCVPDVSADADVHTGYFMVVDGNPMVNGGTSAAAPLWAALIARVNAKLGKSVGYLTPLLYGAAPATQPLGGKVCNDVQAGDNATAQVVGGYQAGPGYDAVTGWGSPNGAKLLAELKGVVT